MLTTGISVALMFVAFTVTTMVFPYVLSFARKHHFLDNPSERKLQRVPVPEMGGTTVLIGLLVSVIACYFITWDSRIICISALLIVMYIIGLWDDIWDISASLRFFLEMFLVWLMILLLGGEINDFHGLWGIHEVPDVVSVPISLIAGVGLINAINLIDGVDGYCSTYCIIACAFFAVIFYVFGDMVLFALALIAIGALIPFFFHNVFGKTSKMFLGDEGSLILGSLLAIFMFSVLSKDASSASFRDLGLSLPALVLAILAIPVFDTLKVMISRMVNGHSPFHPDKTHLHHLFIEMNFSHLMTSGIIVFSNILIVCALILAWSLGAGIDLQMYIVILLGFLSTWGFYYFMEWNHKMNEGKGSALFHRWSRHGARTSYSDGVLWQFIRKIVDSKLLGGPLPREDIGHHHDQQITHG